MIAGAADRRDPGPDPRRLLRRRGPAPRGVASPTPTRRATCRCSRPSASRSPSTPRPAWRPSPASAAGSSSTGEGARRPAPAAADRPDAVGARTPRAVRRRPRPLRDGAAREGAAGLPQSVPGSGWPGSRRRVAPAAAAKLGPLDYTDVDDARAARARAGTACTPALAGICGCDLSTDRGPRLAYFDDWCQLPVRARPRGRRRARRRHPGRARTGARPRGPRLRAAVRRRRPRRRRRLRPPRHRPPRARHPDRVLLLDRRRLGARVRRPRQPAAPHRRRRCPTSGRCSSSRSPAASTPRSSPPAAPSVADADDPVVAVLGAGTMGLAAIAGLVPLRARRARSSSAPATRTSSARPRQLGADDVVPRRRAGPRRAPRRRLPRRRRPPVVAAPTPRSTPSARAPRSPRACASPGPAAGSC